MMYLSANSDAIKKTTLLVNDIRHKESHERIEKITTMHDIMK